jgi:hypothetical protein
VTELDSRALAILHAARQADDPLPEDRARVRQALGLALAAGSPVPGGMSPGSGSMSSLGSSIVGAKLAGVVTLTLGLGFGSGVLVGTRLEHGRTEPAAPRQVPAPTSSTSDRNQDLQAGAQPASASAERIVEPAKGSTEAPIAARFRPAPASATSTLGDELTLLGRAQRYLRAGDASDALAILDSLSERCPEGELAEERSLTRILALCRLGREAEARTLGRAFRRAYPRSVHLERLDASCASGDATSGPGD